MKLSGCDDEIKSVEYALRSSSSKTCVDCKDSKIHQQRKKLALVSCPFVSPPTFPVRAHLVLLVTKYSKEEKKQGEEKYRKESRKYSQVIVYMPISRCNYFSVNKPFSHINIIQQLHF
jgi:hypothetical protein